eukprot:15449241-Alexandrium_andersonii.AAC.1
MEACPRAFSCQALILQRWGVILVRVLDVHIWGLRRANVHHLSTAEAIWRLQRPGLCDGR